jgi:4'-phosphopantetheinyl transferase
VLQNHQGVGLQVWLLRVDALSESDVAPLLPILDENEKARMARFVHARNRIEYAAAHGLTRLALGQALSVSPTSLTFAEGPNGKPSALHDGRPAPVSFNLSHASGMVGAAVLGQPDVPVGFDLERFDRRIELKIADRYFRPEEVGWLMRLPSDERPRGFLRLWTLKEALIKATGEGLSRELDSFWFDVFPPRLHFVTGDEAGEHWRFEQRIVDDTFVVAAGLRLADGLDWSPVWRAVDPRKLLVEGALPLE